MRLVVTENAAPKIKQNLAALADRFEDALAAAANMAASMILEAGKVDIATAGRFGGEWIEGLHVNLEGSIGNMRLSMSHDIPFAGVFETGATIEGHPLLWIGLTGTDAEGIAPREYGAGLFSARPSTAGKTPLMFSVADKKPRYFGVESVNIQKKFHLNEIAQGVMGNFRQIFDSQFRGGEL